MDCIITYTANGVERTVTITEVRCVGQAVHILYQLEGEEIEILRKTIINNDGKL